MDRYENGMDSNMWKVLNALMQLDEDSKMNKKAEYCDEHGEKTETFPDACRSFRRFYFAYLGKQEMAYSTYTKAVKDLEKAGMIRREDMKNQKLMYLNPRMKLYPRMAGNRDVGKRVDESLEKQLKQWDQVFSRVASEDDIEKQKAINYALDDFMKKWPHLLMYKAAGKDEDKSSVNTDIVMLVHLYWNYYKRLVDFMEKHLGSRFVDDGDLRVVEKEDDITEAPEANTDEKYASLLYRFLREDVDIQGYIASKIAPPVDQLLKEWKEKGIGE